MNHKKIGSCPIFLWPHPLEIRPFCRLCLKNFRGLGARAGCFRHLEEPTPPPASPRLPVLPGIRSTMQHCFLSHMKKATCQTLALAIWITNAACNQRNPASVATFCFPPGVSKTDTPATLARAGGIQRRDSRRWFQLCHPCARGRDSWNHSPESGDWPAPSHARRHDAPKRGPICHAVAFSSLLPAAN